MINLKLSLLSTIMIILLSGCIKMDTNLKVNSDGSGNLSLIYALDKQLANTETKTQIEKLNTEAKD